MHIGLYCRGWPSTEFPSGIVTYVHNLRTGLIGQGHRVSVFTWEIGKSNEDSGIHLIEEPAMSGFLRKLRFFAGRGSREVFGWGKVIAAKVNEIHRTDPIDVFEMEESFGWCADVQKHIPIPVVVKLHGPEFLTQTAASARAEYTSAKIEREGEALRRIRVITSPSKSTLHSTLSHYKLHPRVQRVIPNPLVGDPNLELWDLEACDRKTILYVGQFSKVKGGDTALIAFRRLLDADPSLKLIFVGPDRGLVMADGSKIQFDAFRDSLFSQAQRPSISYLGQLPGNEIPNLRRKAMVTIVVSRWENQPNTALEAMIQGCPIVATDVGGMSELVRDESTGLLARPDDIDDLCQKVIYLLSHPAKAGQMGENARRFTIDRHSVETGAKQAAELYHEAISIALTDDHR